MTSIIRFFREHGLFCCILAVGLFFRLLFMYHQGLSNDELSGWIRTKPDTWNKFWFYGVKYGDMHPVFYQAFLWVWVRIFGDTEFSLRATSLLFYSINALLIYRIGIRFFTKHTGIFINAVFAGLAFMIINTVFARPYNAGTFFMLLSFWSILEINRSEKRFGKWSLFLILGFLGAMTSHYAAFLSAGILGIVSLFFTRKSTRITVLLCGLIACIGFLPHLSVTWFHLNRGGLGWLGAPEWNWLADFMDHFCNESGYVILLLVLLTLIVWFRARIIPSDNTAVFALFVFIGCYLTLHIVSLLFTPVLRDLVMLFMLPFLFFFLFNNAYFQKKTSLVMIALLPVALGIHSIYKMQLLKPVNFSVFREIGANVDRYTATYGKSNIEYVLGACNTEYINYYSTTDQPETIIDWGAPETLERIAKRAQYSEKTYFTYAWSNATHLPMYDEAIRREFPIVVDHHSYFQSASSLFKKGNPGERVKQRFTKEASSSFKPVVSVSDEFVGDLTLSVLQLREAMMHLKDGYLLLESKGIMHTDAPLCFTVVLNRNGEMVKSEKDEPVGYFSYDQRIFSKAGKEATFFAAVPIEKSWLDTDVLKIYFWNPEKRAITVSKPEVYIIDPAK